MGRAEERRARQKGARRAKKGADKSGKGGKKTGIRRFFTWKMVLGYFLSMGLLLIGAFLVLYFMVDVPNANALAKAEANIYKYSDGSIMAKTGDVNRESVPLSKIPKEVQHTFVAAENKDFYTDPGVSFTGTARGIVNTLLGRGKQGGSTITQQYVKNYYLSQEQTVSRKLKELVISLKVDQQQSKDDILAGYINTSYYGRNAYGIQAAARAYYNKDVGKLTVAQGAYLAAVLQAPSQYDYSVAGPNGKRLVKQRWNYVLDNMVEKHWLDASEREGLTFPTPKPPRAIPGMDGQTGYFVEAAKQELFKTGVTEDELAAGGWTITLNIDKKKQQALEKAVHTQLTSKLKPKTRPVDGHAQVGAVSVNPKNGAIVAMYGGAGATKHWTNNATREDYQPASTFKPLILAAALENDSTTQDSQPIRANTVYDGDSKHPVKDDGGEVGFAPPNEDNKDYGPINVQKAMNNSVNSVFAQMAVDVGLDKVKKTATALGMNSKAGGFDVAPAMSLGVMGASPKDMAGVYATLDNHGEKVTPSIVKSAEKGGESAQLPDTTGGEVISRTAADSVTSVLTGVVDEGTGSAVRQKGQAMAGKTGTSDENKSAWFTGYTPDLVTSVGMFGEAKGGKQVTLTGTAGGGRVNGGGFPAKIWAAYMGTALDGKGSSKFDLDTDMGAAVPPPSSTSPSSTPPTSASTDPTTSAPPTSQSPTASSSPPTTAPTTPPTTGGQSPTDNTTPPTTPPTSPSLDTRSVRTKQRGHG
ncbi:penicillin-binding protein [Streptomyces bingchenggensis BCW-1]|uniref:Penicillin-binding protein n=1 Tax=Streptomyces bingchenggensis (strain BCW-1) TaxID=749414 RepID=D7BRV8_STRBB|nr:MULTISPECIES: transglycosylase domain-containing protein [Streptomyces]ADI07295.1 penicillin-binding protein [Streptomyces bingchenggensis BCW-1]